MRTSPRSALAFGLLLLLAAPLACETVVYEPEPTATGSDGGVPRTGASGTAMGSATASPPASCGSSTGVPAPAPSTTTTTIDPSWARSNEHFLAPSQPSPDLQYYTANTYPLYGEDNSAAGASFTWTTSAAWNGPDWTDMPLDGSSSIPGYVSGDFWFWTFDRVGDGVTGTTYWFKADVDLGAKANLLSVTLSDKYYPGRIAVNDGLIVFLNGAVQPVMPNVSYADCDPSTCDAPPGAQYGTGVVRDDSATGWTFDGAPLPLTSLVDGTNEIALMFDERFGDGGLGHPVLTVVTQP